MLELCPIHVAGSKFVETASVEITVINKFTLLLSTVGKELVMGIRTQMRNKI